LSAPKGKEFLERLRSQILVFDGAMGTMLFEAGLVDGACPELWNDTHADVVRNIERHTVKQLLGLLAGKRAKQLQTA